jgi:hypothetical protein
MAATKVLARSWAKKIRTSTSPDVYTDIKGIHTLTLTTSAHMSDTTDFESAGWLEHLISNRGLTLSLDGYRMEDTDGGTKASYTTNLSNATNNDLKFTAATQGTYGNGYTVQYVVPSGTHALSVVLTNQTLVVNVATTSSAATSTANDIMYAVNAACPQIVATLAAGNDGTGIVATLSQQSFAGGIAAVTKRDAGQDAVETMAIGMGTGGVCRYRLITPGGTIWEFDASAEVDGPAGSQADTTSWKCKLNITNSVLYR